jgi:2-hydroxy-3-keto-5-methylthiopentenyl-1-phosphate phosphatase
MKHQVLNSKLKFRETIDELTSELQKAESEILSVVSETVIIKEYRPEKPPDDMEKTQSMS